jgi:hypothetical protein
LACVGGVSREWAVWQVGSDGIELLTRDALDNVGAGIVLPVFDEDTGLVFCAGKGDGSIAFLEIDDEAPYAHLVAVDRSAVPQRGVAFAPKRLADVRHVEIRRMFKLTPHDGVLPVPLRVPRQRTEFFQDDLFPATRDTKPSCSVDAWFERGADSTPRLVSLCPADMTLLRDAPPIERKPTKYKVSPTQLAC